MRYPSTKFWGYKQQIKEMKNDLAEAQVLLHQAVKSMNETEEIAKKAIELLDEQAVVNTARAIADFQMTTSAKKKQEIAS